MTFSGFSAIIVVCTGEKGGDSIKALEIIYYVVSSLAFLLSLETFRWMKKVQATNCSVRFEHIYFGQSLKNYKGEDCVVALIRYTFVNHSEKPIAITRVRLNVRNIYYDVHTLSHLAEFHKLRENSETIYEDINLSDKLPINLAGYEARSGFLAYLVPEGTLTGREGCLTVQIFSSHLVSAEMSLTLGEEYQLTKLK